MKDVQIFCIERSGARYRLNELRGDNAAVSGATGEEATRMRSDLEKRSLLMLMHWQRVLPEDKIEIREVDRWKSW